MRVKVCAYIVLVFMTRIKAMLKKTTTQNWYFRGK